MDVFDVCMRMSSSMMHEISMAWQKFQHILTSIEIRFNFNLSNYMHKYTQQVHGLANTNRTQINNILLNECILNSVVPCERRSLYGNRLFGGKSGGERGMERPSTRRFYVTFAAIQFVCVCAFLLLLTMTTMMTVTKMMENSIKHGKVT